MVARPRSTSSFDTSRPTVSIPACTQTWAIPAPIVPSPTTPTLRISTARATLYDRRARRLERGPSSLELLGRQANVRVAAEAAREDACRLDRRRFAEVV